MKYILIFFSCFSLWLSGPCAAAQLYLTKDQIILTESGIFFLKEEVALPSSCIIYKGNGVYALEYYGQCGRCGWATDQEGNCTNPGCNQYGPREQD